MRINKQKLKEAIKIIDMNPQKIIDWILSTKTRTWSDLLCKNPYYWDKRRRGEIYFRSDENPLIEHQLLIPDFVTFNKRERKLNTGRFIKTGFFSELIVLDRQCHNQIIKILEKM